jgi:hypothetical protein
MTRIRSGEILRRLAVATSRWTLGIVTTILILLCTGCSNSGSTANVQNPPPPPAQGITIAFQSTPASTVLIGSTTTFTAVVTNDSTNAGVDWSLTCQSGGTACGYLSAPHTASGQAVTYTPPSNLPGNTEIVNVAGFATADQTQNVLASLNITAFGNNLSGNYAFEVEGLQGGTNYQLAGVIVLDGNGNVTSGIETADFNGITETISVTSGSTYFIGPDGRGTITLNMSDPSISPETFTLVYLSSAHVLIAGTPNNTLFVSASGTMDQQASSISALTGSYAFVVGGMDFSSGEPAGIGGVFNIDSANTISGTGSLADENFGGTLTAAQNVSGTITNPTSMGAIFLTLNFPESLPNGLPTKTFAGYMVDQNHIKWIENDDGSAMTGLGLGQQSLTGTFTDTSFSGTYVFGALGVDMSNPLPDTLTAAAVFSADGAGQFSNGFTDTVFQALSNPSPQTPGGPTQVSASFGGNYFVGPNGRVSSSLGQISIPNNLFRPVIDFYLGGDGTALVLMNSDEALNYPLVATGTAYPQTANATPSGSYGTYVTQQTGQTEYDGTAIMTATLPALTGVADIGSEVDASFSGSITSQTCASTVSGCFSGTFTGAFQGQNINNPAIAFGADFYIINATQGFFVENDLIAQSSPQVTFGYFTTSTAVQQPGAANALKHRRK